MLYKISGRVLLLFPYLTIPIHHQLMFLASLISVLLSKRVQKVGITCSSPHNLNRSCISVISPGF